MKRPKIFLEITAGLLAVVGAISAKAHKFTVLKVGFYNSGMKIPHGDFCTVDGRFGTFSAPNAKIFAWTKSGICGNGQPLYTSAQN